MISTTCIWPTVSSRTLKEGSMEKPYSWITARTEAWAFSRSRNSPRRTGSTPSTTFSAMVKSGMSRKCWCTMPMPRRPASRGLPICTGRPSSSMTPRSGRSRP